MTWFSKCLTNVKLSLSHPNHPTTTEDARKMSYEELLWHLRAIATENIPLTNSDPQTEILYKKLKASNRVIGEVLNERGGFDLMRRALDDGLRGIRGTRMIERNWDGIGKWRG